MSLNHSVDVTLKYGTNGVYTSASFESLFADDDSFEIVSLPKKRLDWMMIENILGYRYIYSIRIQQITKAQRDFLYNYIQSDDQYVTVNGIEHSVYLQDTELALEYLSQYVGNVNIEMEFVDKAITAPIANGDRTAGITDGSIGYAGATAGEGCIVTLRYWYGTNKYGRVFRVASVSSIKADILDHRWEYIDKNYGYKRLGYRLNFEIDFGGFGLGQTQASLQDDRDFIREFVCADKKEIEVFNQYVANVVNDFNEVRYRLLNDSVYSKSVVLNFKAQELMNNLPVEPDRQFILDDPLQGVLDSNPLG